MVDTSHKWDQMAVRGAYLIATILGPIRQMGQ